MFNTSIGSRDGRCRRWRISRQRWPAPRRPPFILNFEFIRLFFSVTGDLPQAQTRQRLIRQRARDAKTVIALKAPNRSTCPWTDNAVDLTAIIAFAGKTPLRRGND